MYRSRPTLPYDILHGIHFPANLSAMFTYLSYFPPPPPVIPGPPPRRTWTCSSSISSLSCFVSDDLNPPSLREYIPLIDNNQSLLIPNTSNTSINTSNPIKSSSFFDYIINLFEKQSQFIVVLIILLIILLFLTFILIIFLYFHRHKRQRQSTSNNKNKRFYYHLIPRREKTQTTTTTTNNNEHKLVRLRKTPPTSQVIRMSIASGIHTHNNNETEEAV